MGPAADELDRMDTEEATETGGDIGEIRGQIEHTRAEMGDTIEAIKEKLSPDHLAEQVRETVRDATVGRVQGVASAVREAAAERAGAAATAVAGTACGASETIGEYFRANRMVAVVAALGIAGLWISAWLSGRGSSYG